jgi:hypothetical protein
MKLPEKYKKMIGTKRVMGAHLFSSRKYLKPLSYDVLDWRWGSGKIMNIKTMKIQHPTVEFLIKSKEMKAARWTKGFPVREIELKEEF